MKSYLLTILIAALLAGLGVGAGYLLAAKNLAGGAAAPDDPHGDVSFDARTLANLGVEVRAVNLGTYRAFREFQAVIEAPPLATRQLTAELPGVVIAVAAAPDGVARAGAPLVTILRDAIPRPQLQMTAEMFRPVSESLHDAFASLRTAVRRRTIAKTELQRVQELNGSGEEGQPPVISRQTVINLRYDLARAEEAYNNAHAELEHHGLSDSQIDAVAGGAHPPHGRDLWRRLLQVHGMWTDPVEKIHGLLPKPIQAESFGVAVLGELVAHGMATAELAQAVAKHEPLRNHFFDVAGLLLRGETLARIVWWGEQGALEPTHVLRAPPATAGDPSAPDWDISEVFVRPGQRVPAGAPLVGLRNPRRMWLRVRLLGQDVPLAADALRRGEELTAKPLIEGQGPDLAGLRLARLRPDPSGSGMESALLECQNQPLAVEGAATTRSWRLRAGQRYVVRMPTRSFEKVFVFAKDAVARQGVDRVVFLRDGASFRAQPVRIVFEDADTVLVAHDGAVFPDDKVVTKGGFVIGVAMQQGSGGNHGHSHPH